MLILANDNERRMGDGFPRSFVVYSVYYLIGWQNLIFLGAEVSEFFKNFSLSMKDSSNAEYTENGLNVEILIHL